MEDTKLIKSLEKVTSDKKVLVAFPYAGYGRYICHFQSFA